MSNIGLGRGLSSLIPDKSNIKKTAALADSGPGSGSQIFDVPLDKIKTNPHQPRVNFDGQSMNELVESIKEHGVIQPLIATKEGSGYELIAGERRLRASKLAGLATVPVVVRQAGEQAKLEMALIENIQRQDLDPIETARAYRRLIDEFNLSQENVAKQVGKSRSTVTNILRMLNLPDEIQIALINNKITEGHAKYLLGVENEEKQLNLLHKIVRNKMTITDTDKEIKRLGGTKLARIKINYEDKDKEFALREFFGARVEIRRKGKGGQVIIDFYNNDELNEIAQKVKK
ncbi:ParB/RepB/Spo0J family partition protein [Candidatus Parcubacteria bacterium]|nr:ParB/RepB/Spo0J family partition protein [Candidatus Parcubacteria bacterium]